MLIDCTFWLDDILIFIGPKTSGRIWTLLYFWSELWFCEYYTLVWNETECYGVCIL